MTSYPISTRLVLVGGLALAVATPALALARPMQAAPVAACTSGEEEDVFTMSCTPILVPNSPKGFITIPANPDVPELKGIPCTGHQCNGISQDYVPAGPQPVPRSIFGASP